MSVRKAHNSGRNHLRNVVDYYQQIGHEKAQSVIDSITSSYAAEGQANPMLQPPGMSGGMGRGGFGPPPPFGFPGGPGQMPPPFAMGAPNGAGRGMPPMPFPGGMPPPGNLPFPFPPPGGFPNAGSPVNGMPPFMPMGPNGMPGGMPNGMPNFPFPPPNQMSPAGAMGAFPPPSGTPSVPGIGTNNAPGRIN